MKTSNLRPTCILVLATVILAASLARTPAETQTNRLRIGVYDSRVIAVAAANAPEFQDSLKSVREEYTKAKKDGDEKKMREIDERMKLRQRRMHEQGFSTGSVIGIMAKVKDVLPGVAREAGVQVIVSKWELNFHSPDIEVVDVTDQVAALFHTSERGQKWLKQIPSKPPIPIEEITDHMD